MFQEVTAIALTTLFLAGCATAPKNQHPPNSAVEALSGISKSDSSPSCDAFCKTITACATEAGHPTLADRLCKIARCETGDKCRGRLVSPTRKYKGPFQFSGAGGLVGYSISASSPCSVVG